MSSAGTAQAPEHSDRLERSRESHARLLAHYWTERDAVRIALADVEAAVAVEPLHVRYAAAVLERLPDVWRGACPQARDGLVGSIWPAGLVFDGSSYRTPGGESLIGLLGGVRAENGRRSPLERGERLIRLPGQDVVRTAQLARLYALRPQLGSLVAV